jgi:hypothetical protein
MPSPPTPTLTLYLLYVCMLAFVGGRKVWEFVDFTILVKFALGRVNEAAGPPLAAVEVAAVLTILGHVGSLAAVLGESQRVRVLRHVSMYAREVMYVAELTATVVVVIVGGSVVGNISINRVNMDMKVLGLRVDTSCRFAEVRNL